LVTIAIGGLHGTGKSTYAKALAAHFKLRHVSAGQAFRRIAVERGMGLDELSRVAAADPAIDRMVDELTKEEALAGNVVIDGRLSPWMASAADAKIFLTAPEPVRLQRMAKRDSMSMEEATELTRLREEVEGERYRRYYGIDVEDLSVYDLIVDTSLYPIEEVSRVLIDAVGQILGSKERSAGPVAGR